MPATNYNDVDAIRAGQTAILRVYVGSALVWGPPPAASPFTDNGDGTFDLTGLTVPAAMTFTDNGDGTFDLETV